MKIITTFTALAAVMAIAASAHANSFTNGDFAINSGVGQVGYNTSLTGWYLSGSPNYTFLYATGAADVCCTSGEYGNNELWGSNNGGLNTISAPPSGSAYFIAQDGDFQNAAIAQDITGLTVGHTYQVGFNYGYAQQYGFSGDTQQNWTVCLGGSCGSTPTLTNPSHGFTGWFHDSFGFTANSTAETLSFLAFGSAPVPPFALLDGVTVSQESAIPEPAVWTMMVLGLGGLGVMARRRRSISGVPA
jgi:hypothetical protein